MEHRQVYMDHSATTPLREEVLQTMLPYFKDRFGNPSSIHSWGQEARKAVEEAREKTAMALGADPSEIYFTGGGTEANNIALKGVAKLKKSGHIITTSIEHHVVLDLCKDLRDLGFKVTFLPVDRYALVDLREIEAAITPETFMISVMAANNEVGTLQPLAEIGSLARERGILFHSDAIQMVGQLPFNVRDLKLDSTVLSAHKFNGPKGVGAIYIRKGVAVAPVFQGGGQERKLRPGTENVAAIAGLGRAIELAVGELPEKSRRLQALRDSLIKGLLEIEEVALNGHPVKRLPGNVNASFKYIEGEALLLSLDLHGIAASSGSACTSGSLDPSHVLMAMGLDHQTAQSSLRFSLGRGNTEEEVDYLLGAIRPIVEKLRDMSALYDRHRA